MTPTALVFAIVQTIISVALFVLLWVRGNPPAPPEPIITPYLPFDEVMNVIDRVFNELIVMKHDLHYKLRGAKLIKNMDDDIKDIATEVIESLSDDFIEQAMYYVNEDYIYGMITRKAQMYLIGFVEQNKP